MTFSTSTTGRWRRRATCTVASTAMIAAGFVALADTANAAPATTIYVNAQGSGAPTCGTSFLQCSSIQAGVNKAHAGDTVLVAAGTYKESVDITSGITVKSADGAATTIIDGDGVPTSNGLVNITQPGGDVTFSGFTVKNQSPSGNDDEFALTIGDSTATDKITVSHNVFPGDGSTEAPSIGVDSADTAATQVITDNEFSGLWEGILLEGSSGPVDVSNNNFHDLIPADAGDGAIYPPKGIFFLGDKNVTATSQNVTDNTFSAYGGIGIDYRAGYNLGGCAGEATCDGSIAGSVTDNKFALSAPAENNSEFASQQPAAISLQSLNDGDQLNLEIGGNTGTVDPPTKTILEVPGDGSLTITPGASPNKIVPQPAPTVALTMPNTIVAGAAAQDGSVSVTNPGGAIDNVRYDVTIKGTKGISASQVKLQYDADPSASVNYQDATLTGTATASGDITGYFGAAAGSTLAKSTSAVVTGLRLSFPDAATPPDSVTTTVKLDQVSSGTGNPVVNTLATSTSATTSVTAPPPAPVATVTATLGTLARVDGTQSVSITVRDTNNAAPPVGTDVDVLVSGATVANGTVPTNASGVATFTFKVQHMGDFTVKAVAAGKSGTVSGTSPVRHVTIGLRLTTPSKGVITVVANTGPALANRRVAIYFVSGTTKTYYVTMYTNSSGVATRNITGLKSNGVYTLTVQMYNDPDSDSLFSAQKSIRVR